MIRAARLDSQFYEMVETDSSYTRESAIVVLLAVLIPMNAVAIGMRAWRQGRTA